MAKQVEEGKLSDFKPTKVNSNKHTAKGLSALDKSMSEDGYVAPITVAADGEVLDGDARLERAFERFGDKAIIVRHDGKTPVVMVREDIPNADDPTARRIHYRANMVHWMDFSLDPAVVMADIESGFDFEGLGVSLAELGEMLEGGVQELLRGNGQVGEDDPTIDKAQEAQEKWQVKKGDVWKCQDHRIVCGDCTDPEIIKRLMGDELADLYLTDPPYGVSYADKNGYLNAVGRGNRIQVPIENDHLEIDEVKELWRKAFKNAYDFTSNQASFYLFMPQGGDQMMMMMMMMMSECWIPRHELIWLKNNHVLGRADYAYKHEPILYGWKRNGTHKYYGGFQTSILEYDKPLKSDLHPTMKPVALVAKLIENNSKPGNIVFDTFLGSGTTLVACEGLKRKCRGVELNEAYTAVTLERWQQLTNLTPQRVSG